MHFIYKALNINQKKSKIFDLHRPLKIIISICTPNPQILE